jgi:glycerate 2-kinase
MISAESFLTQTLRTSPDGDSVSHILAAAVNAVEPGEAVLRSISRTGDTLTIAGRPYDLSAFRRVCLLGIGKASVGMAEVLVHVLGPRLDAGMVVTKHANEKQNSQSTTGFMEGGHPIPDERSLTAGRQVVEFVSSLQPDDLLFCLISGGGSALVTAPLEGVTLADIQALTTALLACGARVDEINTLRRHLDLVKGGGMARLVHGASIVSLILSDVVGNPLEAIASGPTAPDPTSCSDAIAILTKYKLEEQIPSSINHVLHSSSETPKPGDAIFERVQNVIVGSNLLAAQAALKQAQAEGFHPYLLRTDLQGEARQVAFELATLLRQSRQTGDPVPAPACIVAGGETTVTLGSSTELRGRGGRNTELALAAVSELADFPDVMLVTLATDGEDGPTDAAGAVVTGESFKKAAGQGMVPAHYLEQNNSYSFFESLGDLLKSGPTGTNVNDLVFLFTF